MRQWTAGHKDTYKHKNIKILRFSYADTYAYVAFMSIGDMVDIRLSIRNERCMLRPTMSSLGITAPQT